MEYGYIVKLSNRTMYKELQIPEGYTRMKIGTGMDCDLRLYKGDFFEPFQIDLELINGAWNITCSDNIYISVGDARKLITGQLSHGNIFAIKYQKYDNELFKFEFLLDFDNEKKNYDREIDISEASRVTVGNDMSNNIILHSPYVINDNVILQREHGKLYLMVTQTNCGVYLNSSLVLKKEQIANGDFISIANFSFCYNNGILYTEASYNVTVNSLKYFDNPSKNVYPLFIRNVRIKKTVDDEKIEILSPPAKSEKPEKNIVATLLPSLMMMATSAMMGVMGGGRMIMFSIASGVTGIVTAIISMIKSQKDYKKNAAKRIEKYNAYIDKKHLEIEALRNEEKKVLEEIYVAPEIEQERLRVFSSELFDRNMQDEDFLCVRLGNGSIPAKKEISYKKQESLEIEDDLCTLTENLCNEFEYIEDAPVVCNFGKSNSVGIIGAEEYRFDLFKNIVLDMAIRHYSTDLKMVFIAKEENKNKVNWLRFLPNVFNDDLGIRNIVCNEESKTIIYEYLYKLLSSRKKEKSFTNRIVIFFYDEFGFKSHPLSKFIDDANEIGVTFVFFGNSKASIPQGSNQLISISSNNVGELIQTDSKEKNLKFTYPSISQSKAIAIVNFLAPIYTEEISLEGTLTKNISLFELLNILSVDDLDLKSRWDSSQVFKSMAAPLGVSKSNMVCLDLHDKAHGPHGLVAGTTGSGKSEILQSYILSIATLFHPYEIAFLIIDFKGGGMVNQFKNLPHLLGAITNIDGKEIDRSLKSIKAELQKRQRLFAEADVNHIDKYIKKFKSGEVKTPLPHLIVIVDEFAELKAEQPEFMKELISAARIGRSLGVHLILATQKPSGQVDDQIWSNSRFKLCLKVQSQEDSNEVLKSPLAAEIKEPGRAYLQVGNNEVFELFQSAYSGAPEKITDSNVKEFKIFSLSDNGRKNVVFEQKKKKSNDGKNMTQLEAIVEYVHNYCEGNKIQKLPNICLPSLSDIIMFPEKCKKQDGYIEIGVYDDPDNQTQDPAVIDIDNKNTLFVGSSQYGKTNLLQSIIKTIADTSSPKESVIYILDFGSMVLKNFETLNHVGGVVCSSEDEKLKNLFKLIFTEIAERKEKLLAVGVSSFSSYLEAGYTDLPHIYLMIDNMTALMEMYLEDDDSLLSIIREGIAVGISVIISNAQTSGISFKYLSNFANKLAFFCNDNNEYSNLFDHVNLMPDEKPGRCILEKDKRMLECQTYLAFQGEKEFERVKEMQNFIKTVNDRYKGIAARNIPCIPEVLSEDSLEKDFNASKTIYSIPVGLTYSDVEPFYFNLSQMGLFGICGKEGFGHKNMVEYLVNTLLKDKDNLARIFIFDDISRKYSSFKGKVEKYSMRSEDVDGVIKEWYSILDRRYENLYLDESTEVSGELLLMIIQNNDVAKRIQDDMDLMNMFTDIVTRFKGMNACIIFANYPHSSISYDAPEPLRMIKQDRHLLFLDNLDNLKCFDVAYEDLRANRKHLTVGDGFYILDNDVVKLKLAKAE
ncbi:MAG: type VII secretion protein EssC [Clostridiales bacterium]|nr:type VII secretion protein EssC [Clostridiales bacterium]